MSPSQLRCVAKAILSTLGYVLSSQCREHGRTKAWMRPIGKPRGSLGASRLAKRVARELRKRGLVDVESWIGYGDEVKIRATSRNTLVITLNLDHQCADASGYAFVEAY